MILSILGKINKIKIKKKTKKKPFLNFFIFGILAYHFSLSKQPEFATTL